MRKRTHYTITGEDTVSVTYPDGVKVDFLGYFGVSNGVSMRLVTATHTEIVAVYNADGSRLMWRRGETLADSVRRWNEDQRKAGAFHYAQWQYAPRVAAMLREVAP